MLTVRRLSSIVPTAIDEQQIAPLDSDARDSFPGCDADPDINEDAFDDLDDDDEDDDDDDDLIIVFQA